MTSPGASVASTRMPSWLPGIVVAAVALGLAWLVHTLVPGIPVLTACVVLGIAMAQIRPARSSLDGVLKPGLSLASKRLL